jgi:hypothetical protein
MSSEPGLALKAARLGALVPADQIDDQDDALGKSPESLLQFLSHHRQRTQRQRERDLRLGKPGRRTATLLGILAGFALVAIGVLIWGHFTDPRSTSRTPPATNAEPNTPIPTSSPHVQTHPAQSRLDRRGKPSDAKAAKSTSVHVLLTAARSNSWVQIRADNSRGRVLFEGIVTEGRSIRAVGPARLWARFGSLGNFDLAINGRAVHPAFNGTVDTVITPSAIRLASTQTR